MRDVRFRLIPRDESFYPLFSEGTENLAEAARRFRLVLDDLDAAPETHMGVVECERRGDEVLRQVLHRINSSFVTPFDREDIHALASQIDDVVDDIYAASDLVVLHHVEKPLPEMRELTDILVEISEVAVSLMQKLPKLKGLEHELQTIDRLESEADSVHRKVVAHLFSGELKAMDVLKLTDIVEAIEHAVNGVENVADIVESIALKHA